MIHSDHNDNNSGGGDIIFIKYTYVYEQVNPFTKVLHKDMKSRDPEIHFEDISVGVA
jgi:hypothetical protein